MDWPDPSDERPAVVAECGAVIRVEGGGFSLGDVVAIGDQGVGAVVGTTPSGALVTPARATGCREGASVVPAAHWRPALLAQPAVDGEASLLVGFAEQYDEIPGRQLWVAPQGEVDRGRWRVQVGLGGLRTREGGTSGWWYHPEAAAVAWVSGLSEATSTAVGGTLACNVSFAANEGDTGDARCGLGPRARIGTRDGLSLEGFLLLVYGAPYLVQPGGVLTVPAGAHLSFTLSVGVVPGASTLRVGGLPLWGGANVWVRGTGGPGSVEVSLGAGDLVQEGYHWGLPGAVSRLRWRW